MAIDAKKEEFELVELFGKPALLCDGRVDRYTVPGNLFCYDLRGSDSNPVRPVTVEPYVSVNHAGTIIAATPLTMSRGILRHRNIEDKLFYCGEGMTLSEFAAEQGIPYLSQPKYNVCAAKENEAVLFYSGTPEDDAKRGCVGHLRFDIEEGGKFWPAFWDHQAELKTAEFRADLQKVVDELRIGPLASLRDMSRFCHTNANNCSPHYARNRYSFYRVDSESHSYFLRLYPHAGDNSYIYCYDKDALRQYMDAQNAEQVTDGHTAMGGQSL